MREVLFALTARIEREEIATWKFAYGCWLFSKANFKEVGDPPEVPRGLVARQ